MKCFDMSQMLKDLMRNTPLEKFITSPPLPPTPACLAPALINIFSPIRCVFDVHTWKRAFVVTHEQTGGFLEIKVGGTLCNKEITKSVPVHLTVSRPCADFVVILEEQGPSWAKISTTGNENNLRSCQEKNNFHIIASFQLEAKYKTNSKKLIT